MKRGLVLEGGAMRGLFTAGVLDVMMEQGIEYDGAIGVSAGAAFGCNYKSRQPGRVLRYNLRFCQDPRYCSFRSWIKTGDLFGAEFCYQTLPDELDLFDVKAFAANPMDFYVVGTDVNTGKPLYHNCTTGDHSDLEWMRASASMPMASRVVEVDGYRMLDGGITDSIPLQYFQSIGYDRCVVVLTQPLGYQKERNKMLPMIRMVLRKYPKVVEAMAQRQDRYNACTAWVREQERQGRIFVIRPEEALDIGRVEHDPEKIQKTYDIGRAAAEKRLKALQEFLAV